MNGHQLLRALKDDLSRAEKQHEVVIYGSKIKIKDVISGIREYKDGRRIPVIILIPEGVNKP